MIFSIFENRDKLKHVLLMLALTGCATPPRIAVTTQIGAGRLTVTVKNVENRPSTPILLEVSLRGGGGAPLRLIHPAPFVLNRQETREIIAPFSSNVENLEPVVELRIAQTGALLQPTSLTRLPATAAPAIPQPRGK